MIINKKYMVHTAKSITYIYVQTLRDEIGKLQKFADLTKTYISIGNDKFFKENGKKAEH